MQKKDAEYFRGRAEAEFRRAQSARTDIEASAHTKLAELYSALVVSAEALSDVGPDDRTYGG